MFNKFDNKGGGGGGGFAPRPMVKGNWICGTDAPPDKPGCGMEIHEMPFEPTPGRAIYCRDCWKKFAPPRRENRY